MIQRLRRKLVLILMGVVTFILLAAFVLVLLSTSGNARRMSEGVLRQALIAPSFSREPQPPGGMRQNARAPVLVASADADGVIRFHTNQFYFIEEKDAEAIVRKAMASSKREGTIGGYSLRWMKSGDGSRIAFADISMEEEMLKNLVFNALPIGGGALALFFLISLFLARWAVKPVELAWERQRQFVADASHELKTPLTVILSNADMLGGEDEKKARRVEHIRAEAGRMKKLVENMLTLARSDSMESEPVFECVDFSDIVTNTVLICEPVIYDECKRLEYEITNNLCVAGDAERLRQLVQILLDNACKYTPRDKLIEVKLNGADSKTALLTVTNQGEVIAEEERDNIFQRFYRIDKARSAHGGFGLGLSIAEGIVKEHGGRIWVESAAGVGNSFNVSLPIIKMDLDI